MAVLRLVPSQGPATPVEILLDKVVVGREPTCDLVVSDGSVSRKHATIERRGDGWKIVDQGSANGTFVDSQRVTEQDLRNGQELRFGAMGYRVEIEADDGATILTSSPDATVVQEAPPRPPAGGSPVPPPPAGKPAPPPWSAPPKSPVVKPAPPLPTPPAPKPTVAPPPSAGTPPPLPPRAPSPPPPPPRAAVPPPPPAGPPPPRAGSSRPPVVTPVSGGAPPAKKGRSPLVYVGGGCCGCLVLLMVFFGVIGGGAYFMTAGAVEAVRAQIADVRKGDMDAAYGRMTEEYRAQHSQADFSSFVDAHPGLKENTDSTFMSRNVQNNTATISGTLNGPAGVVEPVTYRLLKEGGGWRIAEIDFDGASSSGMGGGGGQAAPAGGTRLQLETLAAEKTQDAADPSRFVIAIKVRATGFGTDGDAAAPRADLILDLETQGPGGQRLPDLSRMELEARSRPDGIAPLHADFDVNVTLQDATPGDYVARLTVRDQIGRDIRTQDVAFTLP